MARTLDQINQSILDNIAARPELSGLTRSATGLFRLVAYVMASASWTLENLFDRHTAENDAKLAAAKGGTAEWYAREVKLFQQGDTLVSDANGGIYYPAGSTGQRLVFQATAKENDQTGKLFIKVAAAAPTAPGGLRALTDAELTQVKGYLRRKKWAGTKLEVVSREADRLRVEGQVYFDPLLELADVQANVRAAIRSYLQNLDFDGLVFNARLEDAIQQVAGVKDLLITAVSARSGQQTPAPITRVYETEAGYIVEEDAPGAGFLDTLDFVPYAA